MAHERKKAGERKDKKTKRMKEEIQRRREEEGEPRPSTDQPDIQEFKPGGPDDRNRQR